MVDRALRSAAPSACSDWPDCFATRPKTMPLVWLKWLVGLLLVHDFVLAPLVLWSAAGCAMWTPEAWRWPLQLGLVTSGVLVLASVPVLVGVGRRTQPSNASVLPGHYPLALVGVLVVVWLGVLALGFWNSARWRKRNPSPGLRTAVGETPSDANRPAS